MPQFLSDLLLPRDADVALEAVTKQQLDAIALTPGPPGPPGPSGQAAGKILYLAASDASDIATYKTLLTAPSAGAEQTIGVACTGTSDFLVAVFATDPGALGAVEYQAGTAFRRFYVMVSAGIARLHWQAWVRDQAGVETLIRDEYSENFSNTTVGLQEWSSTSSLTGSLLATDRIVNKIYAQRVSGSASITVTVFFEGTSHTSSVQTTITTGAQGPVGPGVATGGTLDQLLAKASATNYDTKWVTVGPSLDQTAADLRYLQLTGGTLTSNLTVRAADPIFQLDSTTPSTRVIKFGTNNLKRWQLYCNNTAESGSNVGSDLNLSRYDDAGSFLASVIVVSRSTGTMTLNNRLNTAASATTGSGLRVLHGVAPSAPVDGDIWTTTAGMYARINGATVGPFGAGGLPLTGGTLTGDLYIDRAVNTASTLYFSSGGSRRWAISKNQTAEGGTLTGADLAIATYDNFDTFTGNAVLITRSSKKVTCFGPVLTAAAIAGAAGLNVPHGTAPSSPVDGDVWTTTAGMYARINGATVGPFGAGGGGGLPLTGGTLTGPIAITTAAGTIAPLHFQTASIDRWIIGKTADTESGSNTGSDFAVARCDDAGGVIDIPFVMSRSNGRTIFARGATVAASVTSGAGLNVPHGTAPTSPVNGDVWTTSADGLQVRVNGVTYPQAGVVIGGTKPTSPPVGTIWVPNG